MSFEKELERCLQWGFSIAVDGVMSSGTLGEYLREIGHPHRCFGLTAKHMSYGPHWVRCLSTMRTQSRWRSVRVRLPSLADWEYRRQQLLQTVEYKKKKLEGLSIMDALNKERPQCRLQADSAALVALESRDGKIGRIFYTTYGTIVEEWGAIVGRILHL